MAKRFFYVCAGLFLLALSYHLGARSAGAQAPGNPVVATFGNWAAVVTANGDVYYNQQGSPAGGPWLPGVNVFSGPTPVQQETWGGVKARYRPEGKAQPSQDR